MSEMVSTNPTIYDGEIEFSGAHAKKAKYIVIKPTNAEEPEDKEVECVYRTLMKSTNHTPTLIVSVTGGAKGFTGKQQLTKVFRRGVMKVAETNGAWIISGGTNVGVMKHVGEAVAQHCSAKPTTKVVTLGIATLGFLAESSKFKDEQGCRVKYVHGTNTELTDLDKNHSHFVLVDTKKEGKDSHGGEIPFRAQLEKFRPIAPPDSHQKQVLICCVLLQGGPGSLKTVWQALEKGTPVVVVADSGQCANILAKLYKADEKEYSKEEVKNLLEVENINSEEKLDIWLEGINKCVEYMKNTNPEKRDLLTVFELNTTGGEKGLDVAILQSLIRVSEKETQSKRHLQLAIEWNRADIARSHILVEGHEIPKQCLAGEMLLLALVKDRPAFVRLLLEEVLDEMNLLNEGEVLLSKYEKKDVDEYLSTLLHNDDTKLLDRVKSLLGSSYHKSMIDWVKRRKSLWFGSNSVDEERQHDAENSIQANEQVEGVSITQLFQWAIVTNKREMSRVLWENMTDKLPAALAAVAMLRKLHIEETSMNKKQELHDHGEVYKALALGILTKGYKENSRKTQQLICQKLSVWNDFDCLQLAVDSYFREFVAHAAVQDLVDKWWNGDERFGEEELGLSEKTLLELCCAPLAKVVKFFQKPFVKFWEHVAAYLLFLLLFTYILVFNFHPHYSDDVTSTLITGEAPSPWEWLLVCWVVLHWLNEGFQIWEMTLPGWWRDYWNKLDMMALIPFTVGFVLRFVHWNASRSLLSISFIVFCVRILHFFTVSKRVGPMVSMVRKMVVDLAFFLFVIAVFLLAYGVANQALLYPNENRVDVAIIGIFYKPYWQLYGELFLDEINYDPDSPGDFSCSNNATGNDQRCPEVHKMAPVLSAVYMILAQILLLNLLIALFSYTFSKFVDNYENIWKFQRYKLVHEYYSKSFPPVPFNLLYCAYLIVRWCDGSCQGKNGNGEKAKKDDDFYNFDKWCTDAYLEEKDSNQNEVKVEDSRFQGLNERLENIEASITKILEKLN